MLSMSLKTSCLAQTTNQMKILEITDPKRPVGVLWETLGWKNVGRPVEIVLEAASRSCVPINYVGWNSNIGECKARSRNSSMT